MTLYKKMYLLTEDEYKLYKQLIGPPSEPVSIPNTSTMNPVVETDKELETHKDSVPTPVKIPIRLSPKIIKKRIRKSHKRSLKNKYPNWLTL